MKKYNVSVLETVGLKVSLQVLEIGDLSRGFSCLICQLHGDEYSSILIVDQLLKKLKRSSLKSGVRIILNCNPLASLLGNKVEPLSGYNLNRSFDRNILDYKGNNPGKLLALAIAKFTIGATFCVDLHDMPGSSLPISAILTKTGDPKIEGRNLNLISHFNPQVAWIEDFTDPKESIRYNGTINLFLNGQGTPNFTIETSSVNNLIDEDQSQVANKLYTILNNDKPKSFRVSFVKRIEIYAESLGVIKPADIPLLSAVSVNTILGEQIRGASTLKIKSPASGLLIRKSERRFVVAGEKIFDIGVKI